MNRQAMAEAWEAYVGSQSVADFVDRIGPEQTLREVIEDYVADIPRMFDVTPPANTADLLEGYIRMQPVRLVPWLVMACEWCAVRSRNWEECWPVVKDGRVVGIIHGDHHTIAGPYTYEQVEFDDVADVYRPIEEE